MQFCFFPTASTGEVRRHPTIFREARRKPSALHIRGDEYSAGSPLGEYVSDTTPKKVTFIQAPRGMEKPSLFYVRNKNACPCP
ncbi:hypothetical protein TNCV_3688081 [Trichonephila clavipes]|uniref:Uncharacterized protein n=1 Tax=Trichonephila clavipes TaxID=2585209 RepID=A0A8X6RFN3_TRICX|nr:hypothetical protein TNCV_3688081 [Trichonephila clavipes]